MLENTFLPGGLHTWKNCSASQQHWFLEAVQTVLLTRLAALSVYSCFFFFGVTACLHHESDHIFSFKYIIIYLTICAFLESPLISTPIGVELHHSLHTMCLCSQVLFEQNQWDSLVDQFKQEFCKLYGMTLEPLLNIYMQAGLTALKTPYPSPDHYFPLHLYHLI